MPKQLAITLRRSCIGRPEKHRRVAAGLGLRKMNRTVIRLDTPEIRGMIRRISHLLEVREIRESEKPKAKTGRASRETR